LTPGSSQAPTDLDAHSPPLPSEVGERIGRTKVRKLVGSDKNSLIGEEKRDDAKQCKGKCSPPPTSRPKPRQSPSDNGLGRQPPLLCVLPQFSLLSMTPYGMEHPSGHFRSAVPSCVPSQLLALPQPTR